MMTMIRFHLASTANTMLVIVFINNIMVDTTSYGQAVNKNKSLLFAGFPVVH